MNAKHIAAAFVLTAAAGAVLADAPYPAEQNAGQATAPGKTRAEVKAELAQARADGTIPNYSIDWQPAPAKAASTLTRAQVRADLVTAEHNGELDKLRYQRGA
jgi:hypothetical protein